MLKDRISNREARITVMGLGYVGLPLAIEFAKAGFYTYGYEIDSSKIETLKAGKSYILDVPDDDIASTLSQKRFQPTSDAGVIKDSDVVVICVPTPLRKTRDPDLSFIISAVQTLLPYVHRDMLVVLESTTYPGTTEELLAREIENKGLSVGRDIYVAFSPERVDPANKSYKTSDIPKVVGGVSEICGVLAEELYKAIVPSVHGVSTARTAEMVKLLENTFRSVNIGLVNEMAMICHKMDIDIWEVIDAAKTKPFGYMPFYPGPGIGGHCIPCDPIYLTWKAKMHGIEPRLVELASEINYYMPHYVVDRLVDILNEHGRALSRTNVLVLGVAYKKNVGDTRESPAIEIINKLLEKKANVSFYDPYVSSIMTINGILKGLEDISDLASYDCCLITTDHDEIDYERIVESIDIVFDTRGRLRREGIYSL